MCNGVDDCGNVFKQKISQNHVCVVQHGILEHPRKYTNNNCGDIVN